MHDSSDNTNETVLKEKKMVKPSNRLFHLLIIFLSSFIAPFAIILPLKFLYPDISGVLFIGYFLIVLFLYLTILLIYQYKCTSKILKDFQTSTSWYCDITRRKTYILYNESYYQIQEISKFATFLKANFKAKFSPDDVLEVKLDKDIRYFPSQEWVDIDLIEAFVRSFRGKKSNITSKHTVSITIKDQNPILISFKEKQKATQIYEHIFQTTNELISQ